MDDLEPQLTNDREAAGEPDRPAEEDRVLPSDVLVDALARNQLISSLNASSVPGWLMTEPIELAFEWLEIHGRHCKRPMQCRDTPGPLRPLLKMRAPARRQHEQAVHAAFPASSAGSPAA